MFLTFLYPWGSGQAIRSNPLDPWFSFTAYIVRVQVNDYTARRFYNQRLPCDTSCINAQNVAYPPPQRRWIPISSILYNFFRLQEDVYHQQRCKQAVPIWSLVSVGANDDGRSMAFLLLIAWQYGRPCFVHQPLLKFLYRPASKNAVGWQQKKSLIY